MPSMVEPVTPGARIALTDLLLVQDGADLEAAIVAALPAGKYRLRKVAPGALTGELFEKDRPHAVILSEQFLEGRSARAAGLIARAKAEGIPVLAVVDDSSDPESLVERLAGVTDWVTRGGLARELRARLTWLSARAETTTRAQETWTTSRPKSLSASPPLDGEFFALVIHDLRTPLNVISLSLRMISQAVPQGNDDVEEDLRFVEENFRQIERMLSQLGDYYRLFESEGPSSPIEFSPRRLVNELLEARLTRPSLRSGLVELRIEPSCPEEVALDPARARMALQYALANATAASQGKPIVMTLRGGPDRWVTEIRLDSPPPDSVHSTDLDPTVFERLCGSSGERRGMDLAIAAKISEFFGGTSRLIVESGRGTSVVFDWPVRLPQF